PWVAAAALGVWGSQISFACRAGARTEFSLPTKSPAMTRRNAFRVSKLSLGLIAALAAAPVFAQSTSAGVGGVVTSSDGQPVTGAEVVITHIESGTVSRATTDASGRYNARGLRVGGPYEVTIT